MPTNKSVSTPLRIFLAFIILAVFLVAIDLLGSSFKLLGKDFVNTIITADLNPFAGLFIGILVTVLVQSSSVTTSIVVGMVSGGVISVGNAIPIVMGANIGTTVTNALVSFGHISQRDEFRKAFSGSLIHDLFNVFSVSILLPLEIMTGFLEKTATFAAGFLYGLGGVHYHSPIKVAVKGVTKAIQGVMIDAIPFSKVVVGVLLIILAVGMIFACLYCLVKLLRSIMIDRVVLALDRALSKNAVFAMLIGVIITALVQSSSVSTSLLVPLIAAGVITLEVAFPITLGANIGTTVTALLAAMAGTEAGLVVALVHLLFNISGIVVIYPFKPIRNIPLRAARWLGERAGQSRRFAVMYVLIVFFLIPICAMLISKL